MRQKLRQSWPLAGLLALLAVGYTLKAWNRDGEVHLWWEVVVPVLIVVAAGVVMGLYGPRRD